MASVSSLDKDLRNMRLDKYTPKRATEARKWIEEAVGPLNSGDLLDALKDGSALCKLINLALGPNSVRYKESAMPFVQMENISHFLRACQVPPLNLQAHDVFLTVDLYESKDPAQVLQCIEAFSRRACAVNPNRFPESIAGRKAEALKSQHTGTSSNGGYQNQTRARGKSNASETSSAAGGRISPFKNVTTSPNGGSSSWAKKTDMGATAPAWNISQYGWTGGASQGNQGIMFGGRRQITTPAPKVPSLAEKERKRREEEAEAERLRLIEDEAERKRRLEREAEEERLRAEEDQRREQQDRRRKEQERRAAEEEKRRWEEEERRWREEEELRVKEEKESEARLEGERRRRRAGSDARLKGQFLSQYQAEQRQTSAESNRIKELERQLAEARDRELQYEREREDKYGQRVTTHDIELLASKPAPVSAPPPLSFRSKPPPEPTIERPNSIDDNAERDYLRKEWSSHQQSTPAKSPRPLPVPGSQPSSSKPPAQPQQQHQPGVSPRPLPDPAAYKSQPHTPSRTDRYLNSNPAPSPSLPTLHTPQEAAFNSSAERDAEDARRHASQNKTKAGGLASKSLLEREMEEERQRQKMWEEDRMATQNAAKRGNIDTNAGSGPGQSWDVNSYGYTGGDNLNKSTSGVFGGRRQILGPRPLGSKGAS